MGKSERQKGARAELEVAAILCAHGFDAERNARNGLTAEDVRHNVPGLWLEVKRRERAEIWAWIEQAEKDAYLEAGPPGFCDPLVPVVVFRRNRSRWRADLDFEEFLRIVKEGRRNDV